MSLSKYLKKSTSVDERVDVGGSELLGEDNASSLPRRLTDLVHASERFNTHMAFTRRVWHSRHQWPMLATLHARLLQQNCDLTTQVRCVKMVQAWYQTLRLVLANNQDRLTF